MSRKVHLHLSGCVSSAGDVWAGNDIKKSINVSGDDGISVGFLLHIIFVGTVVRAH